MTFGDVSKETVGALKTQPILLVVVILNVLMLGLIYYIGSAQREERAQLTKYLIDCRK